MITIIACFIASISTASFFVLWFSTVYQEASYKKQVLKDAWGQVQMHQSLYKQSRGGADEQTAARMLRNSEMIYCEAIKSYDNTIHKPKNRIPCLLMGFRIATKKDE